MLEVKIKDHRLSFKTPAGTSRGSLRNKPSWFIIIKDTLNPEKVGFGECGFIPNLSLDNAEGMDAKLAELSQVLHSEDDILQMMEQLEDWPGIQFGLESAWINLHQKGMTLFSSSFSKGEKELAINGLIWMGEKQMMYEQLKHKLDTGWTCIKLKIGAIKFDEEFQLLKFIRDQFSAKDITLRVDANGAYDYHEAIEILKQLSDLEIHSIEQPIKAGHYEKMAKLCENSPIAIALDEELIGQYKVSQKERILDLINPQYIILKPGLIGGFTQANSWIELAKARDIKYWATSALESNIGLNALAQWAATLDIDIPQGLGTGQLYTNNIDSPLEITPGYLTLNPNKSWNLKPLFYD